MHKNHFHFIRAYIEHSTTQFYAQLLDADYLCHSVTSCHDGGAGPK